METYGMHSIHGRAPAIATGLKAARPDLDVWIVTGDGDGLSIGGNHLIHILRRNVDVQILLFNNQIYGLTKGQYSPTSEMGKVTKSSPHGSIDHPFNPLALAMGANASFVARTIDRAPKHMTGILKRAHAHHGSSFVEIYQNCNIFNDGAFQEFSAKSTQNERILVLEHQKPMLFGNGKKGVRFDGNHIEVLDLESGNYSVDDCLVYDETSRDLAHLATRMWRAHGVPRPFGVFYRQERPTYEDLMTQQIEHVLEKHGRGDIADLLRGNQTWTIN
jgi:2-oxoglutarate ferredoxin oxidoreductase subunit beta